MLCDKSTQRCFSRQVNGFELLQNSTVRQPLKQLVTELSAVADPQVPQRRDGLATERRFDLHVAFLLLRRDELLGVLLGFGRVGEALGLRGTVYMKVLLVLSINVF